MPGIKFYNSYSKKIEDIELKKSDEVSIYCCGVTVYDHCHVGHGRIYTLLDTLSRFLKSQGYRLKVIRNITDIDDKILKKAQEEHRPWQEIAQAYASSMQSVLHEQLGCLKVDVEPKATEAIPTMLQMIQELINKKAAYVVDGEVFFSIESFSSYGHLSGQKLCSLQDGQRVAIHQGKKHPGDFTLWKPSADPHASWDSPWGPGRPGWHIECSAMIAQHVQGPLDFHLGGMDLKFPHHENEIAQSESCSNHPLARCWMHGGFVTVNQEKMSKSLKNFQYLDEVVKEHGRNATRYFYLSTHYRQPLELTPEKLQQSQNASSALQQALMSALPEQYDELLAATHAYPEHIIEALSQDLNTPLALSYFHESVKNLKDVPQAQRLQKALELQRAAIDLFGFDFKKAEKVDCLSLDPAVQALVEQRLLAKKAKDFQKADSLRQQLSVLGYQMIDKADGYELLPIKKS